MTTTTPTRCALYFELGRPFSAISSNKYVQQVLITPEGQIGTSVTVPMSLFTRRLSTTQPRRTWRNSSAGSATAANVFASTSPLSASGTREMTAIDEMTKFLTPRINSLTLPDPAGIRWNMVGVPIVVEVTDDDLEDIRLGKTPYKVFGRVWKSRTKLGYPKDFI